MSEKTRIALREEPSLVIIDIAGEVTTFAEDAIMGAYREATQRGADRILVNFAQVDYINSAGVAVMIGLLAEARQRDQHIMVSGLTPHYTKVFDMMGLARYIRIFDNEEDAKRSVQAGS